MEELSGNGNTQPLRYFSDTQNLVRVRLPLLPSIKNESLGPYWIRLIFTVGESSEAIRKRVQVVRNI